MYINKTNSMKRTHWRLVSRDELYRQILITFDLRTGERLIVLRRCTDDTCWCVPYADTFLAAENGCPIWERMPDDFVPPFFPSKVKENYHGYINDPRQITEGAPSYVDTDRTSNV